MSAIKALPQDIVDRIAAGEVVQRPCSIAKEVVENSLDAQCSSIEVSCSMGGLESLQITDDGCGMTKDDLVMAAVRFATSKLRSFDDLKTIRTFGFRGEALASASMVSRLSIISRTAASEVAYKCQYMDGKALPNFPKASAGLQGTTVRIDDLFYNIPSRKKSFKRESDEYNRVLDVVQVGFVLVVLLVEFQMCWRSGRSKTNPRPFLTSSYSSAMPSTGRATVSASFAKSPRRKWSISTQGLCQPLGTS